MDRSAGVKPAGRRRRRLLLPAEKRRKERKKNARATKRGGLDTGLAQGEEAREEKRRSKEKDRGSISLSASGPLGPLPPSSSSSSPTDLLLQCRRRTSFLQVDPYNLPHDFLPSVTAPRPNAINVNYFYNERCSVVPFHTVVI